MAVPAGGSSYYVFGPEKVELFDQNALVSSLPEAVPASAGRPITAGVDLGSGWAAVAYDGGLVGLKLDEGTVRPFEGHWREKPRAVAVSSGLAALVTKDTVAIYSLRDGARLHEQPLADWLEHCGLKDLRYALPLSRQEFVLVGFKPMKFLESSEVAVQKIDLSAGRPQVRNDQVVRGLTWLSDCCYSGDQLYLAGIQEQQRRLPGNGIRPGDLQQTLIVVSISPSTLDQRELVRLPRQAIETEVSQIAVGRGFIALLVDSRELLVFEDRGGLATQPIYERRVDSSASLAWLEGARLLVSSGKGDEVINLQAGS